MTCMCRNLGVDLFSDYIWLLFICFGSLESKINPFLQISATNELPSYALSQEHWKIHSCSETKNECRIQSNFLDLVNLVEA